MNKYVKYSEWVQILLIFCTLVQSVIFWIGSAIAIGLGNVKFPIDVSTYYMRASIFILIVLILQVLKMIFISNKSMNWLSWLVPVLSLVVAIVISMLNIVILKTRLSIIFSFDIYDVLVIVLIVGLFMNSLVQLFVKNTDN